MGESPPKSPQLSPFHNRKDLITKYQNSAYSFKSVGISSNPHLIKKQKMALSIELKRNARKIGKFMKDSEAFSKIERRYFEAHNISGPYVEPIRPETEGTRNVGTSVGATRKKEEFPFELKIRESRHRKLRITTDFSGTEKVLSAFQRDPALSEVLTRDSSAFRYSKVFSANVVSANEKKERNESAIKVLDTEPQTAKSNNVGTKQDLSSIVDATATNRTQHSAAIKYLRKYSYKQKENAIDKLQRTIAMKLSTKLESPPGSTKNILAVETSQSQNEFIDMSKVSRREKSIEERQGTAEIPSIAKITTRRQQQPLPRIQETSLKKNRSRVLHEPKYQSNKEEPSDTMKVFKKIYKSCMNLTKNLSHIDKKLIYRENKMNNKFSSLKERLQQVRDVHFLPEELVLTEEI